MAHLFTSPCNDEPYKPIIDNLRSIGVATVVASGNSGIPFAISSPGLHLVRRQRRLDEQGRRGVGLLERRVVPVAASRLANRLPRRSPVARMRRESGTSMATPHVAGAWAVLRQAAPSASVSEILDEPAKHRAADS